MEIVKTIKWVHFCLSIGLFAALGFIDRFFEIPSVLSICLCVAGIVLLFMSLSSKSSSAFKKYDASGFVAVLQEYSERKNVTFFEVVADGLVNLGHLKRFSINHGMVHAYFKPLSADFEYGDISYVRVGSEDLGYENHYWLVKDGRKLYFVELTD